MQNKFVFDLITYSFKAVSINVKKKTVIHGHVGIIIQFVKLDVCAKRELFVI